MNWRRSFIRSYLERDVLMFAPRLPADTYVLHRDYGKWRNVP
jgi:hypothetical protein